MKPFLFRAVVLLLLGAVLDFAVPFLLQPAHARSDAPIDFTQPQSPAKPAPKWLKIIDQGVNDPRLKGYFTPEGLKVEIVSENPVVVNPVGMTFGDDGIRLSSNGGPAPTTTGARRRRRSLTRTARSAPSPP